MACTTSKTRGEQQQDGSTISPWVIVDPPSFAGDEAATETPLKRHESRRNSEDKEFRNFVLVSDSDAENTRDQKSNVL